MKPLKPITLGPSCITCHTSTTNWKVLDLDHTDLTTCKLCHSAPKGHYAGKLPGQCQDCHSTVSWLDYNYDHIGIE